MSLPVFLALLGGGSLLGAPFIQNTTPFLDLSSNGFQNPSAFPYGIAFILMGVFSFLGIFPFGKWRFRLVRQKGIAYYRVNDSVLMTLTGFYCLMRFILGNPDSAYSGFLGSFLIAAGLLNGLYAGLYSLSLKNFSEHIRSLFVLGNSIILQLAGAILLIIHLGESNWVRFAYQAFLLALCVIVIGFTLILLIVKQVEQENTKALLDNKNIKKQPVFVLFLLGFVTSGLPPLAGFSILWMYIQLLLSLLSSSHSLISTLLVTLVICGNSVIFAVILLGWLRVIVSQQSLLSSNQVSIDFFYTSSLSIKMGIGFLLLVSVFPGLWFVLTDPVITQLTHQNIEQISWVVLFFSGGIISFVPGVLLLACGGIIIGLRRIFHFEQQKDHVIKEQEGDFKVANINQWLNKPVILSPPLLRALFNQHLFSIEPMIHYYRRGLRYWIYSKRYSLLAEKYLQILFEKDEGKGIMFVIALSFLLFLIAMV